MTLFVDISPVAVNRTAMFHIVRDTCKRLSEAEFICLGSVLEKVAIRSSDFTLPAWQEKRLKRDFFSKLSKDTTTATRRLIGAQDQLLLFDPLYALSYSLEDLKKAKIFVLDLTPITVPQWHAPVAQAYKRAFQLIVRSGAKLFAISESTKRDLRINYGISYSDIDVVPLYSRFSETPGQANPKMQNPYFLFVGSLEHRKNVIATIEAFNQSRLSEQGYRLLLAGNSGAPAGKEASVLAQNSPGVTVLGSVSDEQLRDLYLGASGFVLMSNWEGFGLPILEALSLRLPVLTSESGAAPEVAGNYAIYADPCLISSMIKGFIDLAENSKTLRIKLADPSSIESTEREEILRKYTFDNYLKTLEASLRISSRISASDLTADLQTQRITINNEQSFAKLSTKAPERSLGFGGLVARKVLHYLRVIECEEGNTPNDSYSAEYLYFIQQSVRRRAARAWREIGSPFTILAPWRIPLAILWTIWLGIVSSGVKSLLNEKQLFENRS
jgi:glycosyltransferase involved in cell wall biosynthesis